MANKPIELEVDTDSGTTSVTFRMPKRLEMEAYLGRLQANNSNALGCSADLLTMLCTSHESAAFSALLDDNISIVQVVIGEITERQKQGVRLVKKS